MDMRRRTPGAGFFSAGLLVVALGCLSLPAAAGAAQAAPAASPAPATTTETRHDMRTHWASQAANRSPIGVSVAADENGTLWRARVRDHHLLVSKSSDGGATFGQETVVNPEPEVIRAEGQSRPRIAARNGIVVAAWPQTLERVFSGHVRYARSTDGGRTFSPPVTLNDDGDDSAGHGFVALALDDRRNLAIGWLDGRHRAAARAAGADSTGNAYAGSSFYYVLSRDAGATLTPNRKLADHTCECCRIGLAMGPDGKARALWRQLFDGGVRDFAIGMLAPDAGLLRASRDEWKIDGCPHHGGDLAIDRKGSSHIVWYTGSPARPGLFYRRIDVDGGMSEPMPFGDPEAQAGHATVFARKKHVFIVWREFDGQSFRLLAMDSRNRGRRWSGAREIARTDRPNDLPLFVNGASVPLIAWNTADDLRLIRLEPSR